jgi:hypothetical protein
MREKALKRAKANTAQGKSRRRQAGELNAEIRQKQPAAKVTTKPVRSQAIKAIKKALAREKRLDASPHDLAQQARRIALKRRERERHKAEARESNGGAEINKGDPQGGKIKRTCRLIVG